MSKLNPLTKQPYSKQYFEIKKQWESLPAQNKDIIQKFNNLIKDKRLLLISASTGAGKSTQVPKHIIDYYLSIGNTSPKIVCTQPRKIPALKLAERLSDELDVELGKEVGYKFRGDSKLQNNTVLSFVTDGLLKNQLLKLKPKEDIPYDCIIIDEAHERSVNIDILLYVLRQHLRNKNSTLKIVIMSATIQMDLFQNYMKIGLDDTNTIGEMNVEGRAYPVQSKWIDVPRRDIEDEMAKVVEKIVNGNTKGDVLCFLPTKGYIANVHRMLDKKLKNKKNVRVLEFYSGLPSKKVRIATNPIKGIRKVILSTNVAETSVTIHGIVFVVDSGLRLSRTYNPTYHADEINTGYISQANIKQRKGRAGRTMPGVCYHLYGKQLYDSLEKYEKPNIEMEDLTSVYLDLSHTYDTVDKVEDVLDELIQPPALSFMRAARDRLWWYKAVKNLEGEVVWSKLGKIIRVFPTNPISSMIILAGYYYDVLNYAVRLAALLDTLSSVSRMFVPSDKSKKKKQIYPPIWSKCKHKTGDHLTLLKLFLTFEMHHETERDWCQKNEINFLLMKEVKKLEHQLLRTIESGPGWDMKEWVIPELKGGGNDIATLPNSAVIPLLKCLTHALSGQSAIAISDSQLKLKPEGRPYLPQNLTIVKKDKYSLLKLRQSDVCLYSFLVIFNKRWNINYLTSGVNKEWITELVKDSDKHREKIY